MRIVLLTDGHGVGLAHGLSTRLTDIDRLDVVVPVTRDHWAHGLKSCPDVDAFLDLPRPDDSRAAAPTYSVADELAAVGFSPSWMRPNDADIARRIVRTELLQAGYSLSDATLAMAARASLPFGLHPVSDDRAELHVVVDDPDGRRAVHVEEYTAGPDGHEAARVTIVTQDWAASPSVLNVVAAADALVLGPCSPVLSLNPLLSAPGLRERMSAPVLVVERAADDPTGLQGLAPPVAVSDVRLPNDAAAVLDAAREAVGAPR